MDAYDSYRQSGEHSDLFDAFGESRDYWVRSTRERPDRIYPSEPIAGFLRDTTKLSGGWRPKSDAAALLPNAGYVIVDRNNEPVAPPESGDHLTPQTDRIRPYARNYYVEPARAAGVAEVSHRAGHHSRDLRRHDALPAP